MEDASLDTWMTEYRRVSDAILPYFDHLNQKVIRQSETAFSERERIFYDLYLYWNAALVNNGDVFAHLGYVHEHAVDFALVNATGTLQALEGLLPYYLEQQQCADQVAAGEYYWKTKEARADVERLAEDTISFASLLLDYAQKNLFKDVRPEEPRDAAAITTLLRACFPSPGEARLVEQLRAAGNLSVSLVAVADDTVIGHVGFSPVTAAGVKFGAGLAPLAVHQGYRRRGVAAALVERGLDACRAAGFAWAVVLGEPEYYVRFGFRAAAEFGLSDEYGGGAAFQVLELKQGGIPKDAGLVKYAPEFASLGE